MAKTNPALPADLQELARELPPFLSNEKVAEVLDTSARTPEAWRSRGVGPPWFRATNGMVRYPRGGFLRWLANRYAATPGTGGSVPPEAHA